MANVDSEDQDPMIAQLLQRAGRRLLPPADVAERVHANVLNEWQTLYPAARSRRHWLMAAGIAAVLLTGALLFRLLPAPAVSTIAQVRGEVRVERDGQTLPAVSGMGLEKGDRLIVGAESNADLRRHDNSNLLVGAHSELVWRETDELQLLRGQVYHDTDDARASAALSIDTALGRTAHIGTRYRVAINGFMLTVQTRSGRVQFDGQGARHIVAAGQRLLADSAGRVSLESADNLGPEWNWIDAVHEPLFIEGRSVHQVLQLLAEQAGMQVEFTSAAAARARAVVLHGPEMRLPPMAAARAVLATTTLQLRVNRTKMVVSESSE